MLAVGDTIPDVGLWTMTADGPKAVTSHEALGTGTVVLFGVPGAFTPTCSDYHLPSFVVRAEDLRAKGVDRIACIAVNDAFVMGAWAQAEHADDLVMLADGNGEFARAAGLEMDGSGFGLGQRIRRFAAVLEDGVVRHVAVESGPGLEVSSADAVLAVL
ncbi:MAG: peroxiredoxin [Actinomycetota bacterium]|nr:peroxiredoxin [Actinomycetota bacterium]